MRRPMLILALAAAPLAFPAIAAPDAVTSDDRFQIERSGDTIVRLDRKTGAISTCKMDGGQLDCRSSADERAALQGEIDRLEAEVAELKARETAAIGETGIAKDGKQITLKLPSEAEVKDVLSFFEDMLNRLVTAVKDIANGKA